MKSINFNEGIREYMINGDESRVIRIRIEPNMVKRLEDATADVDALIESCSEYSDTEIITEIGEQLCGIINKAFGADICTPAFDGANPLTPLSDGKTLCQVFLEALMPAVEADIRALGTVRKTDAPQLRPEVKKYIAPALSSQIAGTAKIPDLRGLSKDEKAALIAQLLS